MFSLQAPATCHTLAQETALSLTDLREKKNKIYESADWLVELTQSLTDKKVNLAACSQSYGEEKSSKSSREKSSNQNVWGIFSLK